MVAPETVLNAMVHLMNAASRALVAKGGKALTFRNDAAFADVVQVIFTTKGCVVKCEAPSWVITAPDWGDPNADPIGEFIYHNGDQFNPVWNWRSLEDLLAYIESRDPNDLAMVLFRTQR